MPARGGRVRRIDAAFIFLMLVLKIPIAMLLYIVWWAIHATPEPDTGPDDEGGSKLPRHPRPPRPSRPRRSPHGQPEHSSPPRVRRTVARGRRVSS